MRVLDYIWALYSSFIFNFIYLILAVLCFVAVWAFCNEWRLLFVAMHRLLIAVASLVTEHGL